MQKFTVFSVLLSVSFLLMVVDIVAHDYLSAFQQTEVDTETEEESDVEDPAITLNEEVEEEEIALSEESLSETLPSTLDVSLFSSAGFLSPVLKESTFSGLVFQFIPFSDQNEASIYQWNLFDGELYVGSLYEFNYPTETGSFQGYLALRERAMSLTELGSVNEVNNYGDASFYFNHKNKIKTVHLIIRSGTKLYAFEYAQTQHEKMKKVFDSLEAVL